MEIKKFLLNWAEQYFKSRDAYFKNIVSVEYKEDTLLIHYKEKKEYVKAFAKLSDFTKKDLNTCSVIITINNKDNLDTLYQRWSELKSELLKIYFINPLSTSEKRWIINPHVHAKICDQHALKAGLKSLFESVEPITEEALVKAV